MREAGWNEVEVKLKSEVDEAKTEASDAKRRIGELQESVSGLAAENGRIAEREEIASAAAAELRSRVSALEAELDRAQADRNGLAEENREVAADRDEVRLFTCCCYIMK